MKDKTKQEIINEVERAIREKPSRAVIDYSSDPRTEPNNFPKYLWPQKAPSFRDAIDNAAKKIARDINDWWNNAKTPPRRDPLAIDLDADGIETLGLPTSANPFTPILFDHDANRVKTGTGWLKPDDAWLVMDRNGNGTIDSGRELFGVDTLVTAISNVTVNGVTSAVTVQRNATSGFEALAQLDSNGDKVFNAADAQFANLRLWQDANQDGISQSTELKTLASQGVTGIGLVPNGTNQDLGNGNAITAQATVTRSSGASTQASGVNLGAASNLDLADNPFYRQFSDSIALTSSAKALPGMGGSGWVRDLQEAMSLANNASATKLQTHVNAFAAGTTRDAQLSQLDKLLAYQ